MPLVTDHGKEQRDEKRHRTTIKWTRNSIIVAGVLTVVFGIPVYLDYFGIINNDQIIIMPSDDTFQPEIWAYMDIKSIDPKTSNAVDLQIDRIEGIVQNPGWVSIFTKNFSTTKLTKFFDGEQIGGITFPIGEGAFIQEEFPQMMIIKLDFELNNTSILDQEEYDYFGPIGYIDFEIKYLDRKTNNSTSFFNKIGVLAKINDENDKRILYVNELVKDETKKVYEIIKTDEDGTNYILSASSIGYNGTRPSIPELIYPPGNESGYLYIP